jgi:hypothetical protein
MKTGPTRVPISINALPLGKYAFTHMLLTIGV